MSFDVNTGTLVAAAFIFLLGVFIRPLVLVLRDLAIWWWMRKYLLTDQLFEDIKSHGEETELLSTRDLWDWEFSLDTDTEKYVSSVDPSIVLSKEKYEFYLSRNAEKLRWYQDKSLEFAKASHLYNSLVKHYSQEKDNPIEAAIVRDKVEYGDPSPERYCNILNKIINEGRIDYIKSIGKRRNGE